MNTDPIHQTTPERIWLLLGEGENGDHLWCNNPDPVGAGEIKAVEYVRVDVTRKVADG